MTFLTAYNFDLAEMNMATAVVIPIIVAGVQAIKMTGWKGAERFAPLLSIAIGILISFLAHHDSPDLSSTVLNGFLYGLGASGLYSGVKHTTAETREIRKEEAEKEK